MFDGVGMVGAWAVHELVEVVRQSLLGLPSRTIGHGDQRGVVRPTLIFFVFLAPLRRGAFVRICVLGFELVPASAKDRSDHLLARGVVGGDIEQVVGGMGLQTAELMDQGLTGCPKEECADDVHVNDIRKGVASF